MKFSMGNLDFDTNENHVTMNRNKYPTTPFKKFEIHKVNSTGKIRDSPTSSILKTPTAIFVTTRSSSAKTKRLKFANGPVDLQSLRNGSRDSSISLESSVEDRNEDRKLTNNGEVVFEDSIIEVAISPVKTMQVSPESWKAFLEYQKYKDYANETEKTDYTYSRMSKYRHKEIIPGFLVMPNLSRSSLSSRRSSLSLPSNQSSYNESYTSGSYDFNVGSPRSLDLSYEMKMPNNQSNKITRSKYYLRSSTFDGYDTEEVDPRQNNYENEFYSNSEPLKIVKKTAYVTTGSPGKISKSYSSYSASEMPEKVKLSKSYYSESEVPDYQTQSFSYSTSGMPDHLSKSYNYSMSEMPEKESSAYTYSASETPQKRLGAISYSSSMPDNSAKLSYSASEMPEPGSHYYGKVRSMNLDDADIDEVDDNSVLYDKNYLNSGVGGSGYVWSQKKPKGVTEYFTNFFTTMFLYVTSVGTFTGDLFSKYILRKKDGLSGSSGSGYGWQNEKLGYATAGGSWIPWSKNKGYSTSSYYSDRYYGQPRTWYQRFFNYFRDKFSTMTNFIWGNSAGHIQSRYYQTSSKRKFWWFLIPLLLLAGSFLGYIDFFSNPKAVLNTIYNCALFIPSFLYYTVMVFIPRLIFESIPYFIMIAIPHFVTVTLPYFITTTVPYYFWILVNFFASISIAGIWNMLVSAFAFLVNIVVATGVSLYNITLDLLTFSYALSSKYLMLFYSNFCTLSYNLFSQLLVYLSYSGKFVHYAFDYLRSFFN